MLPKVTIPQIQPECVIQTFSEVYDWGLRDLNIPSIHKSTLGEGIKIAVIDSGKSEHFETEKAFVSAKNFSKSNVVTDKNGHSTFVSAIIAAEKNDEGIIGVAPKAKLYYAKAIDDSGCGDPSALANAVNWSVKQQVDIISISAGMFFDFKPLRAAIKRAYERNIIIVCAVGNSGTRHYDVAFPARYPEAIGVAAYNERHETSKFSSRGVNVSFAMPGEDIYSAYPPNNYAKMNGSSFSCPIMSGVCALILSKHRKYQGNTPCNTPKDMLDHLKKYSKKMNSNKETGFGTIDIDALMGENGK